MKLDSAKTERNNILNKMNIGNNNNDYGSDSKLNNFKTPHSTSEFSTTWMSSTKIRPKSVLKARSLAKIDECTMRSERGYINKINNKNEKDAKQLID
jgi:hypothetical protein